jgi:hypothetical protein
MIGTESHQRYLVRAQHLDESRHRLWHFGVFGMTALLFLLSTTELKHEIESAGSAFLLGFAIEVA